MRVGDQSSRIYDLPLAILATSSYREAAGTEQGDLDIAQYITMTRSELSGNVLLLVNDLVDSGVTLARVQEHLKERYPAITAVRSAVLWYKACSKVKPDYHVQFLETNPWIHQLFEEWDTVGASAQSRRMDQARIAERARLKRLQAARRLASNTERRSPGPYAGCDGVLLFRRSIARGHRPNAFGARCYTLTRVSRRICSNKPATSGETAFLRAALDRMAVVSFRSGRIFRFYD